MSIVDRLRGLVGGAPQPRLTVDGLENVLTGLGTDRDPTRHTRVRLPTAGLLDRNQLQSLYRTSVYVRRIVDAPCRWAIRRGWNVEIDGADDEMMQKMHDQADRIGLKQKLGQADIWAGLYRGGVVVLGARDTGVTALYEPLEADRVVDLDWARVYDGYQVVPVDWQSNPAEPGYGDALMYELREAGMQGGYTGRIHASRVLPFWGVPMPDNLLPETEGWGDSRVQVAFDAVSQMEESERLAQRATYRIGLVVFKLQLLELMEREGDAKAKKRLSLLSRSMGGINALLLDAGPGDGMPSETAEFPNVDLRGIEGIMRHFAQKLAASANMPLTLLYGQAPAGLSTDDASGRIYWYDHIEAWQLERYERNIATVYRYLAASHGIKDANPRVTFIPLLTPSEGEEAATELAKAQAAEKWIQWGVRASSQVAEDVFGEAPALGPIPEAIVE